jgi:hypothetical protein
MIYVVRVVYATELQLLNRPWSAIPDIRNAQSVLYRFDPVFHENDPVSLILAMMLPLIGASLRVRVS